MINCHFANCPHRAKFGFVIRQYCGHHKISGMVYLDGILCYECNEYAMYNHSKARSVKYCEEHKFSGMIIIPTNKCAYQYSICKKLPRYNYFTYQQGLYCREHKLPEMIHVSEYAGKKCLISRCYGRAYYNLPGSKEGDYCYEHKSYFMIRIVVNNFTDGNLEQLLLRDVDDMEFDEKELHNMMELISN